MATPSPLPVLPPLLENNFYFDIPLQLEAIPTLYGVVDIMPDVDFILSETYVPDFNSTIMSCDLLKCCLYYNSENNVTKCYFTSDISLQNTLAASIDQIIYCDLFKLIYSKTSKNENNPAMYPNSDIAPQFSSFSLQYIQYLSSSFFTNPETAGPFANIDKVIRHMMEGYNVTVNIPAVIDLNNPDPLTNIITPASVQNIKKSLGRQFVDYIKLQTSDEGTNTFVFNIFEQILAAFPERYDLTDNSLEGVLVSLPFKMTDRINFDVIVNGSLTLHLTAPTANSCHKVNYAQPSLLRMFPSTSTDPSWTQTVDYAQSSRSSLTLIPKTFRVNLCLSAGQDISQIPSLYSTKILLENVNQTFNPTIAQTSVVTANIYSSVSLPSYTDRKHVMNKIYAEVMQTSKLVIAIKANSLYSVGATTTYVIVDLFIQILQNLNAIVECFSDLRQDDFSDPNTHYYSNQVGGTPVNTCASLTSVDFADTNKAVLNYNLIIGSIKIAMKSLAYNIGQAFNTNSNLDVNVRIRNGLSELVPFTIAIMGSLKTLCNPIPTFTIIDTFILANIQNPSEPILPATAPPLFPGYSYSLLNLMRPLEVSIMSMYEVLKRPIQLSGIDQSIATDKQYPSMYKIANYTNIVAATLKKIDIFMNAPDFISDLCVALSSMVKLAIICATPTQFDIMPFINSFIDPIDQDYLTTALNYGSVINASGNLQFTEYCQTGNVVTLLDGTWYDLINGFSGLSTTELISNFAIFADQAAATAALATVAGLTQLNGVNAATALNNAAGSDKSLNIMGGINNISSINGKQTLAEQEALQLSLSNKLTAAQAVLLSAQAALLTSKNVAAQALVLADSTVLATAQALIVAQALVELTEQARDANTVAALAAAAALLASQADPSLLGAYTTAQALVVSSQVSWNAASLAQNTAQTAYITALGISDANAAALVAANLLQDAATNTVILNQSVVNGIQSNLNVVQLARNNAYQAELICKQNRIAIQNAAISNDVIAVINAYDAVVAATGQQAIDAANTTLNAALLTAKDAATLAVQVDQAQIVTDVANVLALAADNAQLTNDQAVLTAINLITAHQAATPIVPATILFDMNTLTSAFAYVVVQISIDPLVLSPANSVIADLLKIVTDTAATPQVQATLDADDAQLKIDQASLRAAV